MLICFGAIQFPPQTMSRLVARCLPGRSCPKHRLPQSRVQDVHLVLQRRRKPRQRQVLSHVPKPDLPKEVRTIRRKIFRPLVSSGQGRTDRVQKIMFHLLMFNDSMLRGRMTKGHKEHLLGWQVSGLKSPKPHWMFLKPFWQYFTIIYWLHV